MGWHADLKKKIHSMRLPIKSTALRNMMGAVYFAVPVVIGVSLFKLQGYINQKRDVNATIRKHIESSPHLKSMYDAHSKHTSNVLENLNASNDGDFEEKNATSSSNEQR